VEQADAPAGHLDHAPLREVEGMVMVTANRLHRRDPGELGQRVERTHVTGVEDQVNSREKLGDSARQVIEELRAVGVGNDADPGCLHSDQW
jgi:hypothetical protein